MPKDIARKAMSAICCTMARSKKGANPKSKAEPKPKVKPKKDTGLGVGGGGGDFPLAKTAGYYASRTRVASASSGRTVPSAISRTRLLRLR